LHHIFANLTIRLIPSNIESYGESTPQKKAKFYEDAARDMEYTKRYLALLDAFPEFRAKEEAPGSGYFPGLIEKNFGAKDLIDEYERRLRGADSKTE